MVRGAFTLIELIFAIVVIAISVISLPTMTQSTSKGIETNIAQEAIFAAATEINEATTAHWDENSMQDDKNGLARVIDVEDNSCSDNLRVGHLTQSLHRRCLDDSSTDASNSANDDEVYALEDMQKSDENLTDSDADATGYKKNYTTTIEVSSDATFGSLNSDKNIKLITVTIKSDGDTITKLKTYSSNIGEVDYYKKVY